MAAKVNVAELVAQMPETDKDIQARKEAEKQAQEAQQTQPPADPNAKPKQKPKIEFGAASKFTGPDPQLTNRLFEQALAGGRDALDDLVQLVRDPADPAFKEYKAEYFLHGLAIYVSAPGREARPVVQALASQIGNAKLSAYVRGFMVRELRVIGTKDAVTAIGKLLNDEEFCADAAAALVSIGDPKPLRDALSSAKGKCRLVLMQSLGALRDDKSLKMFRSALTDSDRDVRLSAAWALARVGDAASANAMLKLADVEARWERIKATQACLLLAETLAANGHRNEARMIYSQIRATRTDPGEAYLRDLAEKALVSPGIG